MGIYIYESGYTGTARLAVIKQIEANKNTDKGSKHIVIVPDRYSLSIEKGIFEKLNYDGACDIDVVSFTRLAVKELGNNVNKCLTKEGAVIALRQVIDENAKDLRRYGSASASAGFAKEMYAVIASIRNSGYTPEDLEKALPTLERNIKLYNKLHDVKLLFEKYLEYIGDKFEDSTTRLDKFIKLIEFSESIKNSHIYILGFPTFSGKQYEIIKALGKYAKSVNISAVTPSKEVFNADKYPLETLKIFASKIKDEGVIVEEKNVDNDKNLNKLLGEWGVKEPFLTINRNLFAFISDKNRREYNGGNDDSLIVYKERNTYEEINAVAHEIKRLVKRENYRYKDITIVNCDVSTNPVIKSVFERYGIPVFCDTKYPLKNTLPIKYVFSLLEATIFNMRKDKTVCLVKEPLFCDSQADAYDFENYVLKYAVDYNGFKGKFDKEKKLEKIEALRVRVEKLCDIFAPDDTINGYCDRLSKLLEEEELSEKTEKVLSGCADSYVTDVNSQAVDRLNAVLVEMKALIGSSHVKLEGFYNLVSSVVAAEELSAIPQYLDSVFLGDMHESIYGEQKILFVVGASEDVLPSPHSYQSIMTATDFDMLCDKNLLKENSIRIYPTPIDLVREDEYLLLELIASVKDKLYIGYASAKSDGTLTAPSSVIEEICRIVCKKDLEKDGAQKTKDGKRLFINKPVISLSEKFDIAKAYKEEEQVDSASGEDNAFFEILANYTGEKPVENKKATTMQNMFAGLSEDKKDKIRKLLNRKEEEFVPISNPFKTNTLNDIACSITDIENFYNCPYQRYLSKYLKLNEREEGELRPFEIGIFIHEVMELFFKKTFDKNHNSILDGLSEHTLEEMAYEAIETAKNKMLAKSGAGTGGLSLCVLNNAVVEAKRACKALVDNILMGNYRPAYTEYAFGFVNKNAQKYDVPPIETEVDGEIYKFNGKIDRIDTCGDRAIILDYKTGSVSDNPLAGLYYGVKLQQFLYPFALKNLNLRQAGAFYVPIKDSKGNDVNKYKAVGIPAGDRDNVVNLDKVAYSSVDENNKKYKSPVYPIEVALDNKTQELILKSDSLTEDGLKLAGEYALRKINTAIKEIKRGNIEKSPLDECKHCMFSVICGDAVKDRARSKNETSAKSKVKETINDTGEETNG